MSKSAELLSGTEDGEACDQSRKEDRSRLNLNGNRQLSRSATELRASNEDPTSRPQSSTEHRRSHHQPHHRHVASVAQRTQTFFATLKSRWVRGRSKERRKTKESGANQDSPHRSGGLESDYAADYSSEHSRSSSATQSPARVALNHPGSPLARRNRDKSGVEDSPGRSSDVSSQKGSNPRSRDPEGNDDPGGPSTTSDTGISHQDDSARRRELALRQHAFFQLRLHIRRGANLVAMDRCGASDPYVKIKCSGRLLHKSRTVHRELNPVWDESVTLPIEDPFQSLNIKVFDYDWGLQDDFMGAALLDLTQLELGQPQDIILELKDPARPRQHLGEIYLTATLWPRNQQEKEQINMLTIALENTRAILSAGRASTTQIEHVSEFDRNISDLRVRRPGVKGALIVMEKREDIKDSTVNDSETEPNTDLIDKSSEHVMSDSAHHLVSDIRDTVGQYDEVKYKKGGNGDKEESKINFVKTQVKGHERSKLSRTRNFARKDYSASRGARRKYKPVSALKVSLERRVGSVEKIIEGRVERILEDNTDKHPWLQPIETWITERKFKNSERNKFIEREESKNEESEKERGVENENCEVKLIGDNENSDVAENNLSSSAMKESLEPSEIVKGKLRLSVPNEEQGEWLRHAVKSGCQELVDKVKDGFKEKVEDITRYFQRTNRLADVNRRLKSQIWSSVVTIVLVEAKNLIPMDIDGLSDPYVKFRLGTEKYKSKVVNKTVNPVWLEQFDLHLYEDPYLGQELEVTVWDRDKSHQDDLMGRTMIDLAGLERETTHRIWRDLEDGAGSIFLLLTISGTTASETISDLAAQEDNPKDRERMLLKYSLWNSLQRPRDVGHLTVKVYRAQGLAAADLGGKSDPFCVLELVNSRLQTQTEYKTLAPNWQKIFTFNVKDINSVLEVTVYDEDRDHKVEFLGKIAIPLLRIRNGEKRWYSLKDKKLRGRAKGNFPQILLEMTVIWNVIRACARTLNPKEKKYMEPEVKFKRQLFLRNVLRLKAVIMFFIDLGKYIQSCWEWESKTRSIVALTLFVLGCYYFEPWMFPAAALLIMLKYCIVSILTTPTSSFSFQSTTTYHDPDLNSDDCPPTPGDDDEDEDDKDKEEKKSLKERLQAIQEVTQTVQNSIGYIASLCERVKNLFNFTVPYLSYLAMLLAVLGVSVLYLIPVRYLILFWGVNKFLRKLLRPHSVPNNEVLDLISRVPDDEDLHSYRELKPMPTADCERGGISTSPSSSTSGRREQRKKHKGA